MPYDKKRVPASGADTLYKLNNEFLLAAAQDESESTEEAENGFGGWLWDGGYTNSVKGVTISGIRNGVVVIDNEGIACLTCYCCSHGILVSSIARSWIPRCAIAEDLNGTTFSAVV
jgi:hypothetical protein